MFNVSYDNYDDVDMSGNVEIYDPRDVERSLILPLQFTCDELDNYCSYVMSMNEVLTRPALINAKTMFEIIDKRPYFANDNIKARFEFITLALEARIDHELVSKALIKSHILRNCDTKLKDIIETDVLKSINKLSDTNCKYLTDLIHENLIEGTSLVYFDRLNSIYDKKAAGGYKRLADFSKDMRNLINSMSATMRKSEEYLREGQGFDLSMSSMKATIPAIGNKARSPVNRLKTGIQYLNKMLNGGLESQRSYLYMGVTGVGKSIVLLSTALWIMRYNKFENDGCKKAVLFISQENSKSETFERLFNIAVTGEDLGSMTDEQISDLCIKAGIIVDDNDLTSCNFIFRYYNDKEIGVDDIDALISDFERDNIKIVCVIQDYIEKLKPPLHSKSQELRIQLGAIATALSELAKKWNIPVVSAAQLNRLASSVIDNAVVGNKTNTTKLLGKQNISESWDMMKNVDAAIIINREIDDTQDVEKQYMGFKLEKMRGKPDKDKIYLFLHPFDQDNQIVLSPDVELTKALSKIRLEDFSPLSHGVVEMRSKNILNTTTQLPPAYTDDDDDDFMIDLIDMIDDGYKDSNKNYVDLYNNADRMMMDLNTLIELEKDHRASRDRDRRECNNLPRTYTGYIRIKKGLNPDELPQVSKDGLVRIVGSEFSKDIK